MKLLAIIPARGGSKRLPRKNLQRIGTKSLVEIAVEQAMVADIFARIVVSTDDDEIAATAVTAGANAIRRPPEISGDDAKSIDAVRHAVEWMRDRDEVFDGSVLLQPTSPMRTAEDIRQTAALIYPQRFMASFSVAPVGDLRGAFLMDADGVSRPLAACELVRPNGAVYALRNGIMLAGRDWFTAPHRAYLMPVERSIDIDTEADLYQARALAGAAHEPV